jgi:uncharacterized membrane protein (DUF485 family)
MTHSAHNGGPPTDWAAIERMPEFQELVTGRRRFAWVAGGIGIGLGVLYVVLVATAHDLMGTKLAGSFSLGFAGGVGLVLVTWAITFAYMRRSSRVWGPLEASVRERALAARVPEPQPSEARDAAGRRFTRTPIGTQEVEA